MRITHAAKDGSHESTLNSTLSTTVNVRVAYFGTLRMVAGATCETLAIGGSSSIADIFHRLGDIHGESLKSALLDDNGVIRDHLLISVDDEEVDKKSQTLLFAGCEVSIFSPISGG